MDLTTAVHYHTLPSGATYNDLTMKLSLCQVGWIGTRLLNRWWSWLGKLLMRCLFLWAPFRLFDSWHCPCLATFWGMASHRGLVFSSWSSWPSAFWLCWMCCLSRWETCVKEISAMQQQKMKTISCWWSHSSFRFIFWSSALMMMYDDTSNLFLPRITGTFVETMSQQAWCRSSLFQAGDACFELPLWRSHIEGIELLLPYFHNGASSHRCWFSNQTTDLLFKKRTCYIIRLYIKKTNKTFYDTLLCHQTVHKRPPWRPRTFTSVGASSRLGGSSEHLAMQKREERWRMER